MDAEHASREPTESPERVPGESGPLEEAGDSLDVGGTPTPSSAEKFAYCEIRGTWPLPSLLLSLALHILALTLPLPEFLSRARKTATPLSTVRIEYDLRWTGSSLVLPPISPRQSSPPRPSPTGDEPEKPTPHQETPAPQTIISTPPQPNHPTQTLLTPFGLEPTDLETPELQLPNLVIPPSRPDAPELTLDSERLRLSPSAAVGAASLPVPRRPRSEAELALTESRLENLYPRLTAEPRSTAERAPEVSANAGEGSGRALPRVLALSAQPVPPTAVLELPQIQLRARFATGSEAGRAAGGSAPAVEGVGAGEAGGAGPMVSGLEAPHVFVAPAGPAPPGPVLVGPGSSRAPSSAGAAGAGVSQPSERPVATEAQRRRAEDLLQGITPGTRRSAAAGYPRIYTIYINMPNLTSQTGSWVLRFAEPGAASESVAGGAAEVALEEPIAITKVDPRYPAAARRARLEGSVYLYGLITKEGQVRDVAVVRGLDDQLDANAVEAFRRWRFKPGRKHGAPVPLEVVVEIPFRLQALF